MGGENLAHLFNRAHDAAQRLQKEATEILEMAKEIERRAKDIPAWYAGMRARVEARATLEHAEELRQVLDDLGEQLGDEGKKKGQSRYSPALRLTSYTTCPVGRSVELIPCSCLVA